MADEPGRGADAERRDRDMNRQTWHHKVAVPELHQLRGAGTRRSCLDSAAGRSPAGQGVQESRPTGRAAAERHHAHGHLQSQRPNSLPQPVTYSGVRDGAASAVRNPQYGPTPGATGRAAAQLGLGTWEAAFLVPFPNSCKASPVQLEPGQMESNQCNQ